MELRCTLTRASGRNSRDARMRSHRSIDAPGARSRAMRQHRPGRFVRIAAIAAIVAVGVTGMARIATAQDLPKNRAPGGIIARTEEVTAKVDSVDAAKQTVTLSGLDDQPQTVQVAPDVDLSGVKAGDDVVFRVTSGLALWVARPKAEAEPAAATVEP